MFNDEGFRLTQANTLQGIYPSTTQLGGNLADDSTGTARPHSSLGYRPPAPEALLTNNMGCGKVETATRFPLLHTPDGGYLNSEIAALH